WAGPRWGRGPGGADNAGTKRGNSGQRRGASSPALPVRLLNFSARSRRNVGPCLQARRAGNIMPENPVPVCAAADLPPGSVKSFEVGGELVAVYNIDGTFYATEARCTHATADLADGILDGDVIECSLHFGAFNVCTGKAVQSPCFVDLKTFRTAVKDGQVFVDLATPAAA